MDTYINKECVLFEPAVKQQCPLLAWHRTWFPPTKAIALKADWCVFQHTQQKYHIEVQSPRTSKTVLINLLTTTECFIINLQMLFNYNSHRCHNQGALLGLKTY